MMEFCSVVCVAGACFLALFAWMRYRGLEYVIMHYRWVFVCLFLLPMSVVYDVSMYIRAWIIFRMNSAPKMHTAKVKHVQEQVRCKKTGVGNLQFNPHFLDTIFIKKGYIVHDSSGSILMAWREHIILFDKKKSCASLTGYIQKSKKRSWSYIVQLIGHIYLLVCWVVLHRKTLCTQILTVYIQIFMIFLVLL